MDIVMVGQTPPPYGGQAVLIQAIVQGLQPFMDVLHVRMAFSDTMGSIARFRFNKLGHLVHVILETMRTLRKSRNSILYYPPAGAELTAVLRDLAILLMVRPFARKIIFHFHTSGVSGFVSARPWLRKLAAWAYGGADLCIIQNAMSRKDAEYFNAKTIQLIPCGLDVPLVGASQEPGTPFRILYVGTHGIRKGIRDLVETARLLRDQGVAFELHSVGQWYSEEDRVWCEDRVKQYGLQAHIRWTGNLVGDALWREYANASAFFFPTAHPGETFGLVLLEAMAYGVPIVASRWPGPMDIIEHEATGLLCTPGDTKSYADALLYLIHNPDICQRLGSAGRARYEARYTFAQYLNSFMAALKTIS